MTLTSAIDAYVTLKRSLGAGLKAQETILRAFGRALGEIPLDAISAEACATFCRSTGAPTRFWENKHQTLRGFFTYLVSRGYLIASPLQEPGPRAAHAFQPYIYSHEELQRLLQATVTLTSARFPLQPLTYRTLLLILYGAGLRASEGLRLRCCDVDLCERLLSIWDTKFFKSRVVPIGEDLGQALRTYRQARESLPKPAGSRAAFFAARSGDAISRQQLEKVFRRLRQHAGIGRPATDRWQPRLHDLRHTMAVHRVIAWYRESVDVEARLPLLAAYLGHVNVSGTQIYLTMTPELLAEASWRFERYAAVERSMPMANPHVIGPLVRRFLLEEVGVDRNLSINTQRSYRDALRLLFHFLAERYATEPTQVTVEHLTVDVMKHFLTYLEEERGNAADTRNLRLTAMHSFFRFVSRQIPELIEHATQIHNIPLRRTLQPTVTYLEQAEIDAVLATPDRTALQGQRDYALLLFLYNTGARATEAAQTNVGALQLDSAPAAVRFLGKGRKVRLCPLWSHTVEVLRGLLGSRLAGHDDMPVFLNLRRQRITRFGIHTLVERTVAKAASTTPSLRQKKVSPHTIRHTTAVALLRAGVDMNTIRAWLGHVSLETTNRYAQVDLAMKAKALETCAPTHHVEGSRDATPVWHQDHDLMAFLASL